MRVYHGSTVVIDYPLVAVGRERLDFGKGFYLTDIKEQAETWATRISRIRACKGFVNVYELDIEKAKADFSYRCFEYYDNDWLQYIVANRIGRTDLPHYDMIEGGVADDRVIDTVEAYMANMMPLEIALRELSSHRPNNQLCITNQAVIDGCLRFVMSYKI